MTKFDNKFVPTTPKIYTVSELRDTQQPVKKSPLSAAARSKVINRSGSNYLSESKEGYGPCSWPSCPHSGVCFEISLNIEGDRWWGCSGHVYSDSSWTWSSTYSYTTTLRLKNIEQARSALSKLNEGKLYTVNQVGWRCTENERYCRDARGIIKYYIEEHEKGERVDVYKNIKSDLAGHWNRILGNQEWGN